MKKTLVLLIFVLLCCSIIYAENVDQNRLSSPTNDILSVGIVNTTTATSPLLTNPIHIVSPVEGAHLPALSATFVCGSVPPDGKLSINGTPVRIHPGGGFLVMVRLTPGEFHINAELQIGNTTYNFTRTVLVAAPELPAPVSPLTIEYVTPGQDLELLPGDYVDIVCKGSPGVKAYFSINGLKKKYPMTETDALPGGIYHGLYQVGQNDKLNNSKIKVTLENDKREKKSLQSTSSISLFPSVLPVMVETMSPDVVLRAGPALGPDDKAGYLMFPPLGTILQIAGRRGDEYRVRLSKTKSVWVNANQVKLIAGGIFQSPIVVGGISVSNDVRSTKIRIPMGRKIPFQVDPDIDGKYVDLSFYGAYSNTDLIKNPVTGVIKSISWFQDDEETYRLRIHTIPNSWWGYDTRYEGNDLIFELRTPPPIAAGSPLFAGLTIAVDAGHSADSGAIGATGYAEKDANLALALNLKEKLTAKGANVIMVRKQNENVNLLDRPKIAWQNKADILISIHNNSLPYGGNPFNKHGFGVYYYTPMSLQLAKEIHTAYRERFSEAKDFNLPDDGLYYDNLALTRTPQMPSVLTESAYMIVPEEEAYLKTDSFRSACANAILTGIERYIRDMRPEIKKAEITGK
jgi:N-acetylmuramoyl-L-alanine amidase